MAGWVEELKGVEWVVRVGPVAKTERKERPGLAEDFRHDSNDGRDAGKMPAVKVTG